MKVYTSDKIRNVALLGHSGSGKTSLAEALVHATGATNRLGRVEDGTTVSDWDEEETRRKQSINLSVIPCEYKGAKINVLDTPGYSDFVGEVISALRVTEAGIIMMDAVAGVEVGVELAWQYLEQLERPRMLFINKMDRDNASFERSIEAATTALGGRFVPVLLPIGSEAGFKGVISVLEGKAYLGRDGKASDVPAHLADALAEAQLAVVEVAAESDDDLLMKYLDGETLSPAEVAAGLSKAFQSGSFVPVLCGSATGELGLHPAFDAILSLVPAPASAQDANSPVAALVFKTIADAFVGRISIFRNYSGVMQSDARLFNVQQNTEERMGQTFILRGREQMPIEAVHPGDIAAVAKLGHTITGDTLTAKGSGITLAPAVFPNPLYAVAVSPLTQADSAKIGTALNRVVEEDPSLRWVMDPGTRQMILSGMGDVHIGIAVNRMKHKFGVNVETSVPKVPYRETVSRTASSMYRHKKQTGGAGQFGEVHLRVEPGDPDTGLTYTWEVFGGAVSSSFMPSIEKGIRSVMENGVLAGYQVVDVKVAVYDGKEHPVDSKDIAFQIAGREAFKQAFKDASPVFQEPIYKVEIMVPEAYMGEILGDLNTRRARVQGMDTARGKSTITAEVPYAELLRYANDLRSMTQGRGVYNIEFLRYENVPAHLAQEIIATAKREHEEEEH